MNQREIHARLRALGLEFNVAQIMATRELYAPLVARPPEQNVAGRDLQYGPDPKQRLDLFVTPQSRATLVFVHGGGFVQGDKGEADAPFYNNVAAWALQQGYSAVNVTYRLAPAHPWPTGPQELALALDWLQDELPRHQVDPRSIVLMGQSAGASHVAAYLAGQGLPAERPPGIAAAVLVSGIFDVAAAPVSEMHVAYFGPDTSVYPARSTLPGLAATQVPCLFTVSELDPPMFQLQTAAAIGAYVGAHGRWPAFEWLRGHNHLSSVLQLGSPHDDFGPALRRFIDALTT
jgi:triacylglycerol lipase